LVDIGEQYTSRAAGLLQEQLGEQGLRRVGGRNWWQWRRPEAPLRAEWIEMRADYSERKRLGADGNRVMLYVHGGAYFFGSVDEHRYQMQRYARKLKARVFAPEYRLAPQFPFPCGLQDCLAAYLFLLEMLPPSAIILAGDSAGGGMVLSVMVTLRDRGLPLPAGAVLISPWVDLTHSFPSVSGVSPMDYIPSCGFHQKPSAAWPPPNDREMRQLEQRAKEIREMGGENKEKNARKSRENAPAVEHAPPVEPVDNGADDTGHGCEEVPEKLTVEIDGQTVKLVDQIQACIVFLDSTSDGSRVCANNLL
jgi:acetyl esterase/lipase